MQAEIGLKQKLTALAIEVGCALAVGIPTYILLDHIFEPDRRSFAEVLIISTSIMLGIIFADVITERLKKRS